MGWFEGTLTAQTAFPTMGSPGQPRWHQTGRSVAGVIARYLPFGLFEWGAPAHSGTCESLEAGERRGLRRRGCRN